MLAETLDSQGAHFPNEELETWNKPDCVTGNTFLINSIAPWCCDELKIPHMIYTLFYKNKI
jgi:hypothetical protein